MARILIINRVHNEPGVNKATVNILIAMILVYSAIKINANGPALYSILKPDTNSDSPSIKSYGVRFVSARIVANQIGARIGNAITGHEININDVDKERVFIIISAKSMQRDMPTS